MHLLALLSVCRFLTRTLYPELKEQLKELRKHLVESTNEMAPLKVWQMQGESSLSSISKFSSTFYCNMIGYVDTNSPCETYV